MTRWYVKELSKLTHVSVQTLHYYDKIALLKPSLRLDNGYRLYSEADLLKLQQILALKFFGFDLFQIKALLTNNADVMDHLSVQSQLLQKKAATLIEASNTLKNIIAECREDKSVPWKTIIKSIEVYQMTQQLEQSWVKEIFTPEELKQYAAFETELKTQSLNQKTTFETDWQNLVAEISQNLKIDPKSEIGINIGERCMILINGLYGRKNANLRTKIFEKGFAEGKGLETVGMTIEIVKWLDQALDAYWKQRIYSILAQVGKTSESEVLNLWNAVLDDMYGEDSERKIDLVKMALEDARVSKTAKNWLKAL